MFELFQNEAAVLRSKLLDEEKNVAHLFTTRKNGFSAGEYAALNLGLNSGDDPEKVAQNRVLLAKMLKTEVEVSIPNQCHGDKIVVLSSPDSNCQCDALVTKEPNLPIAVLSADCVPILLFDPTQKVIAAIHAGWKGTASQILLKTINFLNLEFGCQFNDIKVAIGPCISQKNYPVGENVLEAFEKIHSEEDINLIFKTKNENLTCDLSIANALQAKSLGVLSNNIDKSNLCTFAEQDLLFSARRQGFASGRQAAAIMIR